MMTETDAHTAEAGKDELDWLKFDVEYFKTLPGILKIAALWSTREFPMDLVSIINKLQDVFSTIGCEMIQLPQIIVVGAQSSGKSSVLESLVGKSFLPRGTGVITRRPLILQLSQSLATDKRRNVLPHEIRNEDWGVFLHDPSKIYTNFDEIREEIIRETERKAGSNKGICGDPIVLKIFSEKVLNLTMVDLPGITKVPVGDQPADVENMVQDLILKYISNPNSLILAVVTANTDMATSESLKMAKEVDPVGARTLAVVTKLDLMDAGTDAKDVLNGHVIPVKLGIIGVVNRSQKDISESKSIVESAIHEMNFLRTHYPSIAHLHGSAYLAKRLQALLMDHIQGCLPDLRAKVNSALCYYQALLSSYGKPFNCAKEAILSILTRYTNGFCSTIQGTRINLDVKALDGGARISYIFHETFARALSTIDPVQGLNQISIMTAIKNASGVKPSVFVPQICFELLVKKLICKLESPSLRCVELIHEEMARIAHNCGSEVELDALRFPELHRRMLQVVVNLLQSRIGVTCDMVEKLIQMQSAYINTAHPDFVRDSNWNYLKNTYVQMGRMSTSSNTCLVPRREKSCTVTFMDHGESSVPEEVFIIERLITSYFDIVKKTIQDSVPKAIMHFLVNYVMDNLLSELVSVLYQPDNLPELLLESPTIQEKRGDTIYILGALEKANSIISEIKDTKVW